MLEEDDGSGVRPQGLRTADAGSAAEAEGEGKAEGHQALEDHRARVMYAWETVRARRAEEGKDPMGGVDLQTSPGDEHFAFELLRKDPEVQLEVLHMMNQKGQQGE